MIADTSDIQFHAIPRFQYDLHRLAAERSTNSMDGPVLMSPNLVAFPISCPGLSIRLTWIHQFLVNILWQTGELLGTRKRLLSDNFRNLRSADKRHRLGGKLTIHPSINRSTGPARICHNCDSQAIHNVNYPL